MSDSDNTIQVIFHPNHLGMAEGEEILDTVLRMIAWANTDHECRENAMVDKYGIDIENDAFLMHPYCWCGRDNCLWCSGCTCPDGEMEYFLDGIRVQDWWAESEKIVAPQPSEVAEYGTPEHEAASAIFHKSIEERDRRLKRFYPARIHTCQPAGLMENRERTEDWRPRQQAPHFWHKPSGFKAWWYKYIGRDTETNRDLREGELEQIIRDCVPNPAETYRKLSDASEERNSAFSQMIEAIFKG